MSETMVQMSVANSSIRFSHSENLPELLSRLGLSVLISTYMTNHLIVVASQNGKLVLTFHLFERAMGIAIKPGTIAVGTGREVWFLRNTPDIAKKMEPQGLYNACFQARTAHFTGDIRSHEVAWVGDEFWVVNTLFSCLSALHPYYSFAPRWRPSFISALAPEDRCHLNGLAVANDQALFATSLAETDTPQGWRHFKPTGGCLMEIPTGQVVARGLSLPHSPRVEQGQVYLLQSGLGCLSLIDSSTGKVSTVTDVPGIARGLAIHGGFAFIGLSKARPTLDGVPIVAHRDQLMCGLVIVELQSGKITAKIEFINGVEEIFDVQVLPGITSPFISGPYVERDSGQPLWTISPA